MFYDKKSVEKELADAIKRVKDLKENGAEEKDIQEAIRHQDVLSQLLREKIEIERIRSKFPERKIIQIACNGNKHDGLLFALCDDGTVLSYSCNDHYSSSWNELPPIPQRNL